MKRKTVIIILTVILSASILNGCASSDAMKKQISEMQEEVDKQANELQAKINEKTDQQPSEEKETTVDKTEKKSDQKPEAKQEPESKQEQEPEAKQEEEPETKQEPESKQEQEPEAKQEEEPVDQSEQDKDKANETDKEDESFTEKYDNEIVVCAEMFLDRFINNYKIPLAPQLWTIANFDENGAIMATVDITEKSSENLEKAIVIFTPDMDGDKMVGGTPHYVSVGETVYGNDGYCDEFFSNIEDINNTTNGDASDTSNADSPENPSETTAAPEPVEPAPDMVWIDDTGKKYHSNSYCSNMSDPYQVTRPEAESMGRDACKKCY